MFSPFSEANSQVQPGKRVLTSQDVHWTSLLFEKCLQPGTVEEFCTIATPDQTVVLTASGEYEIEVFSSGYWRRARYGPGDGGATAPQNTNRIRWRSPDVPTVETVHMYIPAQYFTEAAEEYRRLGRPAKAMHMDALSLADPTVFSLAQSLVTGVQQQAPNLYADAAARMLAVHILLKGGTLGKDDLLRDVGSELTDRRLSRVIEFMHHHFAQEITLDQLANEAGISRFHFVRLFRKRLLKTPHQYLVDRRLAHARFLLRTTDLDIGAVANACGYTHAGRFSKAFRAAFATLPSAYRKEGNLTLA